MTINHAHKVHPLGVLFALAGLLSASSLSATEPCISSLVQQVIPAVVRITGYIRSAGAENDYRKHGESSGFFFDRRGLLFTVYSIFVELKTRTLCEKFEVELYDGRILNATIFAIDPVLNIAILKMTEENDFPILDVSLQPEINSGEEVCAVAGRKSNEEPAGFTGRVKAKNKTSAYGNGFDDLLINTYMELPGYAYGGPLVNNKAEVLGINMIVVDRDSSEEKGSPEEHAVPISTISTIYKVLLANPTFEQKWLGFSIHYLSVTERALLRNILQQRGGVSIDFVWEQGPAAQAGIRSGDILVGIDGNKIISTTHFKGLFFRNENEEPELKVFRNGQVLYKQVRVEKRPPWAAL